MMGSKVSINSIFQERVTSLLEDGYRVIVKVDNSTLLFAKLRNLANGNHIVLKAYPQDKKLVQYTNNILVHQEQL